MLLDSVESTLRTYFVANIVTTEPNLIVLAGNEDPQSGVVRSLSEWCVLNLVSLTATYAAGGGLRRYFAQFRHRIRTPLDDGQTRSFAIQKNVIDLWDGAYANGLDTNIRIDRPVQPRFGGADPVYPGFWLDTVALPIWFHHTP